jgi:hypothetical protein
VKEADTGDEHLGAERLSPAIADPHQTYRRFGSLVVVFGTRLCDSSPMTYMEADYQTVLELVTPTPERVATAKAWIAEHRSDHAQWGPEGAESEFAASHGELDPAQINSRDPANQDQMIRWMQWAGAFRSAISEFERAGLLVPVFQSTPDSPAQSGWGFFTRSVGVPLGGPGENVTPSPTPLPLIYAMYAWSPLTEAEKKRRLERTTPTSTW